MPRGGKLDRAHTHIMRSLKGKNTSGRAWAVLKSRGMAKQRGKHIVGTRKLYHRKK